MAIGVEAVELGRGSCSAAVLVSELHMQPGMVLAPAVWVLHRLAVLKLATMRMLETGCWE